MRCSRTASPSRRSAPAPGGHQGGPAENITTALPAIETPENIRAAELATREMNAPYLTVMLEGRYTDAYLSPGRRRRAEIHGADLEIIASPVDFVGLNVYSPGLYVLASEAAPGYATVKIPSSYPRMASEWLMSVPRRSTGRRAMPRSCGT